MAPADFTGDSHLRLLASLARTLATSSQDIRTEKTAEVHKPSAFLGLISLKINMLRVDGWSLFGNCFGARPVFLTRRREQKKYEKATYHPHSIDLPSAFSPARISERENQLLYCVFLVPSSAKNAGNWACVKH